MTRKHAVTGDYIMICDICLPGLGIPTVSRVDLGDDMEELDDEVDLSYRDVEVFDTDFMDFDETWLSSDDR